MDELPVNRVAQSSLVTFNLEDFYQEGQRKAIDLKDWLFESLVLREKEFRAQLAEHDWGQYEHCYVALFCSTDAIIPKWAYILVATKLQPFAKKTIIGNLEQLETSIYQSVIENLDLSSYKDKPVIIKGCSNKPVPLNAYVMVSTKIQQIAKSVMYGEACSAVPLFKRK